MQMNPRYVLLWQLHGEHFYELGLNMEMFNNAENGIILPAVKFQFLGHFFKPLPHFDKSASNETLLSLPLPIFLKLSDRRKELLDNYINFRNIQFEKTFNFFNSFHL